MTNEPKPYRHRKREDIERMLRAGVTTNEVARTLHCDKRAVAVIRRELGIDPFDRSTSLLDKLVKFSTEADAEGHRRWTGRTYTSGNAVLRHQNVDRPATHVAFTARTGREPVGTVKADCGLTGCVEPTHLTDDIERRDLRAMERALYGLPARVWDTCPEGHDWDTHGRFEPDLTPYCRQCNTDRKARYRSTGTSRVSQS